MAAQYVAIKRISSLDTPITAEKLDGSLFTTENQAHEFIVSVRKNGVKQTVTGSVSGKFIRANGTTIFLQGSIVDGEAVVRLHQDCYNVQGRFTFNIFNTQSGVTTCIYSAVGKMDMGSTETVIDAGDVVPDISDVVAKQEEMTQVISDARTATTAANTAAQNVGSIVAGPYSAPYDAGDYCTQNGNLYKAKQDISSDEEWTASHWTQIVVGDEVNGLKSALETTTGNEQIQFSDPALKQYILLSGNTVSFTPYTATVANVKYAIVDCSEGDKFTINGTGGGGDRLWAFVDANKNVLVKSDANVTATDLLLIAPANATNLIINDETDKESYIGELVKNRITEIENIIDEITEYSSLEPYTTASGLLMTDGTITAGNYVINKYRDIAGKQVYINGEGGFNTGNNFCYVWFVKNGVMVSNIPVTIKPQTFNHYAVFVDDTFDEIWINRSVSIDLMERIAIDSYARKNLVDIVGTQWRGKKWYAYGTSMTSVHQGTGKYPTYVQQFSGMVLTEKGIGGGGICNNTQIKNAVMNITDGKLEAELITLEVGANDTTAPLGTIYDTGNDTFCGALNQCIRYLQENTTAQIVVISSTNARRNSGGASASPEVTYGTDNHTKFDQWKATKEVCEINSCYYIPMGETANMSWARMNASNDYNTDDIHHTDLGGYNLAKFVWYCLRNIPLWYTAIPS